MIPTDFLILFFFHAFSFGEFVENAKIAHKNKTITVSEYRTFWFECILLVLTFPDWGLMSRCCSKCKSLSSKTVEKLVADVKDDAWEVSSLSWNSWYFIDSSTVTQAWLKAVWGGGGSKETTGWTPCCLHTLGTPNYFSNQSSFLFCLHEAHYFNLSKNKVWKDFRKATQINKEWACEGGWPLDCGHYKSLHISWMMGLHHWDQAASLSPSWTPHPLLLGTVLINEVLSILTPYDCLYIFIISIISRTVI